MRFSQLKGLVLGIFYIFALAKQTKIYYETETNITIYFDAVNLDGKRPDLEW